MASPNINMRDPAIYRIRRVHHQRTGDAWCIYPMYDFAHGQSDSIETITHSICTMEFIPHRELYDWLIEKLEIYPSHQYEFARRNINYTVTSKRKLLQLVTEKHVTGWDDPRMPTISGLRRRGYTPESIRNFAELAERALRLAARSTRQVVLSERALALVQAAQPALRPVRVYFVGVGEKLEDLETFDAREFAQALLS